LFSLGDYHVRRALIIVGVLLLLCVLAAVATYQFTGGVEYNRDFAAESTILSLSTQLRLYRDMNGSFPTTEQGLDALVVCPASSPVPEHWLQLVDFANLNDPWHRKLQYRQLDAGSFDLFSLGPDGVESSDDIRVPAKSPNQAMQRTAR
jgi:general secretion pathway protein G